MIDERELAHSRSASWYSPQALLARSLMMWLRSVFAGFSFQASSACISSRNSQASSRIAPSFSLALRAASAKVSKAVTAAETSLSMSSPRSATRSIAEKSVSLSGAV
ncbi:hypothetical protein VSQ78_19605 [Nocardiopsis alba]|uniref:Uncharacterized protein n=1 Tax=Nocardiopsis alba TaxID=53437 RepID=A0ABV5DZ96_9ACTN